MVRGWTRCACQERATAARGVRSWTCATGCLAAAGCTTHWGMLPSPARRHPVSPRLRCVRDSGRVCMHALVHECHAQQAGSHGCTRRPPSSRRCRAPMHACKHARSSQGACAHTHTHTPPHQQLRGLPVPLQLQPLPPRPPHLADAAAARACRRPSCPAAAAAAVRGRARPPSAAPLPRLPRPRCGWCAPLYLPALLLLLLLLTRVLQLDFLVVRGAQTEEKERGGRGVQAGVGGRGGHTCCQQRAEALQRWVWGWERRHTATSAWMCVLSSSVCCPARTNSRMAVPAERGHGLGHQGCCRDRESTSEHHFISPKQPFTVWPLSSSLRPPRRW